MINVYDAPNSLEAHMVLNLLEQAGISGRIDGEYLQGAAGELPPGRLIRVMVEEGDVEDAMAIIREWDASQPAATPAPAPERKGPGVLPVFIAGCITGGGFVAFTYNSPVTTDGIDFNGDGRLDERYIYKDDRLTRIEIDRNLDGKPDLVYILNLQGLLESARSDDDFDGVMETRDTYDRNLLSVSESDIDNNGIIDYRTELKNGLPVLTTMWGSGRNPRSKVQHRDAGILRSADYDSNGDGIYDIHYEYDALEEIASKQYLK